MKKDTYFKKVDAIRKKAINTVANVISAPAQIKSKYIQNRADREVNIIKKARAYDNASDWNNDGTPSNAAFARADAAKVKEKILKRNAKNK